MSRWEVGVKSGQNYTNVLEVSGVSHITTERDFDDNPVEVRFFSGKKGTVPTDVTGTRNEYQTKFAVPYSQLAYIRRLPKKGKKNG